MPAHQVLLFPDSAVRLFNAHIKKHPEATELHLD